MCSEILHKTRTGLKTKFPLEDKILNKKGNLEKNNHEIKVVWVIKKEKKNFGTQKHVFRFKNIFQKPHSKIFIYFFFYILESLFPKFFFNPEYFF